MPGAFTQPASISGCLQITQAIYLSKRLINTGAAKTQHKKVQALACALAHWCFKELFARPYLPKTNAINQFQTIALYRPFVRRLKKKQVLTMSMFCFAFFPLPPSSAKGRTHLNATTQLPVGRNEAQRVKDLCGATVVHPGNGTLGQLHWGKQALSHTDKPWQPMQVIKAELCRERLGTPERGGRGECGVEDRTAR